MDFELTEEQAALREVSRGMLAVSCPPSLVRSLATAGKDVDDKLWQRGTELGWTGLAVPEEQDGAGQGLVELCLVAEEIGRAAAPGPFADSALTGLVLARLGRPELLSALAAGDLKASLAQHGSVTGSVNGGESHPACAGAPPRSWPARPALGGGPGRWPPSPAASRPPRPPGPRWRGR